MKTAIIYKIISKDENVKEFYIGSTFNLNQRINEHKFCCTNQKSNEYNKKCYKYIRDNDGWLNFNFIILETFDCENNREKEIKEQDYIDEIKPTLNINKAYQTEEQFLVQSKQTKKNWYEKNKQLLLDRQAKYNEQNYEKLNKKHNCECGGKFTIKHKSTHLKSKKHTNFISSQ